MNCLSDSLKESKSQLWPIGFQRKALLFQSFELRNDWKCPQFKKIKKKNQRKKIIKKSQKNTVKCWTLRPMPARPPPPEAGASCLSRFLFLHMTELIRLGSRRVLQFEDLGVSRCTLSLHDRLPADAAVLSACLAFACARLFAKRTKLTRWSSGGLSLWKRMARVQRCGQS